MDAGVCQRDADDSEPGSVWIFDSDSVYRRDWETDCDRRVGVVCAAADSAEYVCGDCECRPGCLRIGDCDGHDVRAVVAASAVASGGADDSGGDSRCDRDYDWNGDHRGGDRGRGIGGFHFPRRGDGGYDADSGRSRAGGVHGFVGRRGTRMDRTKIVAGLIFLLASCGPKTHVIRVGSKNFTEQVVLGEIIAQHLENRLHEKVARSLNLGGTLLAQQGLLNREIDMYPEYSGTALAMVLKAPVGTDLRAEYARRFHLAWMAPLGIDNGFAMVVRRSTGLKTLSEAARIPWALGVGYEFEQRADGLAALKSVYGMRFNGSPKTMDLGLLYQAIGQGQVDMIAASATDGVLSKMDLQVLEDDRHAFPPYEVSIVAREELLGERPAVRTALEELAGKFTNAKMRELNYQVDVEHKAVGAVAEEFLRSAGLR